jgi:KDO2-lipid IV(A) lauroyltransferase
MFKYLAYKFGQFWVNYLPPRVAYSFAVFMSDLHYYFSFRDRAAVKNNLKAILPSDENWDALTKEVFRNFGKYLVDFFRMARSVDQQYIQENVTIKNQEALERMKQEGKGAVLISAHLGNWELGGAILSHLGFQITAIALPHKERPVNDLFNQQREVKGLMVVPMQNAIRKCMQALRNNQFVAVVADRNFGTHGHVLDFLGKKALMPNGAAVFSLKTGAPIVPIFIIRNADDSFTVFIEDPIYPPRASQSAVELEEKVLVLIMNRYLRIVERFIKRYPAQWMMFRRYWLTEGELNQENNMIQSLSASTQVSSGRI